LNKEEFEAQTLFKKLRKQQDLTQEFEQLRPNWQGSWIRFLSMLAAVMFLFWLYPDLAKQPVLYVVLIVILGISAELHNESKKINKRIDTLYQLLKSDD